MRYDRMMNKTYMKDEYRITYYISPGSSDAIGKFKVAILWRFSGPKLCIGCNVHHRNLSPNLVTD